MTDTEELQREILEICMEEMNERSDWNVRLEPGSVPRFYAESFSATLARVLEEREKDRSQEIENAVREGIEESARREYRRGGK